jgi:hypothetical protein
MPLKLGIACAVVVSAVALASGCGRSGDGAPTVTLTDKGCTYSGAESQPPKLFQIKAENQTLHFANFQVFQLADGKTVEDARRVFAQAVEASKKSGKPPKKSPYDEVFEAPITNTLVDPEATSLLPVNESSGRLALICVEEASTDTRQSSTGFVPPTAAYVPAEVTIG